MQNITADIHFIKSIHLKEKKTTRFNNSDRDSFSLWQNQISSLKSLEICAIAKPSHSANKVNQRKSADMINNI